VTIHVASRRRSAATLAAEFPGARIIDVTSKADEPWVRLSPFYPHGGIPVPLTPGVTAQSVEGIWQALKVFASADVDPAKLEVTGRFGGEPRPLPPGAGLFTFVGYDALG
jgi:hypothetical protein